MCDEKLYKCWFCANILLCKEIPNFQGTFACNNCLTFFRHQGICNMCMNNNVVVVFFYGEHRKIFYACSKSCHNRFLQKRKRAHDNDVRYGEEYESDSENESVSDIDID